MNEEVKVNSPALKHRTRVELCSEKYGTFRLRNWAYKDSIGISKLYRDETDPRAFAEQLVHRQMENPDVSLEQVRSWNDEFLLDAAAQWWRMCEQHKSGSDALSSFAEFRDAVGDKLSANDARVTEMVVRLQQDTGTRSVLDLISTALEPQHPMLSSFDIKRLMPAYDLAFSAAEAALRHDALSLASEASRYPKNLFSEALQYRSFTLDQTMREVEKHSQLLREFDSQIPRNIAAMMDDTAQAHRLHAIPNFYLPVSSEIHSLLESTNIAAIFPSIASVMQPKAAEIEAIISGIRSPWMDAQKSAESMASIVGLTSLGKAVRFPFESASIETLQAHLGDFGRNAVPASALWDWKERQSLYIEDGFDTRLTALPEPAFTDALYGAGLLVPGLFSPVYPAREKQPGTSDQPDEEKALKERMREAYDIIFTFETGLRAFLEKTMEAQFGPKWLKQRIPGVMRTEWEQKREEDVKKGKESQPLLSYADFSDYVNIIIQNNNWNEAFGAVFFNKDEVKVSFQRLQPLRICTMHCRPISKDDFLMLTVEVQLLLRRIGKLN